MMPHPPLNDSACPTGNGFQMSNTRKSIKPSNKYFQFAGASAKRYVKNCPETSSMTTNCGSCFAEYFATRSATRTPPNASARPTIIARTPGMSSRIELRVSAKEISAFLDTSQKTRAPTTEPQVPGAFGRYPAPPAVAKKSDRTGLRGVEEALPSVFGFMGFGKLVCLRRGFIQSRPGNSVFLAGPVAKVGHAAAFAAKREILARRGIRRLLANGTSPFHGRAQARIGNGCAATDAARGVV